MKILNLFLPVLFIFIVNCQSNQNLPAGNSPQQLIDDWVKMWNNYDLNRVDQLFLADSSLTYFSSEREGVIVGIDSVLKHHENFGFVKGGKDQPNKLWLEDLKFVNFGNCTVVTGIWFFQRGSDDAGTLQRGPVTFVCIKQDQQYRIAHVNFGNYEN